ncbi:MAG: bifunctional diaminohydroxyphosphoribosylaminopyrimidine deaminase/5-amino-6-(5-phosphoribosylamino)uracil reductase RibD [Acetobacteraceae bacterium]|nr:bifunctional diaminohydroxyphosphoribosylaminopyrimidine deaminase/5-amino-6-(5-phosphoribosylamino)uracil reductase RibD [Acetobacteraceae bacterium]
MRAALALARRGNGLTWPNPSVGCVIVRDGRVVGRATTAPGGRPHAEPQALAMAGIAARGATAYVTLEPCCFHGRTPPCTDALIAAGVARVVIGVRDPDTRVNGAGLARLRAAGIAVTEGVLADEAEEVVAGFFTRVRHGRPLVTLKLASTLDGRIATHGGESQWITGAPARRMAHALRGRHDAVMVGVGTALADDPDLTCRLPGFKPVPTVRVVADSHLRLRLTARLVATAASAPTWVVARQSADSLRAAALESAGVAVLRVGDSPAGIDLADALRTLAERGITRLLVEGGAQLSAALLRADLVDRLVWFHAPAVMGGDGWPAAQGFGVEKLAGMAHFEPRGAREVGADLMSEYGRARRVVGGAKGATG